MKDLKILYAVSKKNDRKRNLEQISLVKEFNFKTNIAYKKKIK